jgi:hypothetical protein
LENIMLLDATPFNFRVPSGIFRFGRRLVRLRRAAVKAIVTVIRSNVNYFKLNDNCWELEGCLACILTERQKPQLFNPGILNTKESPSPSTSFGMEYCLSYIKFVDLTELHNT